MGRILYIGGCTRSGSTLVDRMLGQLPGFVSTGEFGLITTHSITENRLCGCGRRFRDCPYWTAVGEKAFGGWDSPDSAELVKLHPQVTRQRYIPLLIAPSLSPRFARKLRRYQALLGRLYGAVNAVSGADDRRGLHQGAGIRAGDPRHPRRRPAHPRPGARQPRHGVLLIQGTDHEGQRRPPRAEASLRGAGDHARAGSCTTSSSTASASRASRASRCATRTSCGHPRRCSRRSRHFAGSPSEEHDLDFITPPDVHMREDHTAVGNDSRLDQGTITLREDDAWRTKLPAQDRKLVTLMSWPLLKRWRYV